MTVTNILIIATILAVVFFMLTMNQPKRQLTIKEIRDKCVQDVIVSKVYTEIVPDDIDNFMRESTEHMVLIFDSQFNGIVIYSTIKHDTVMYHLMVAHENVLQSHPKVFSSNFAYINHSLNLFRENVFHHNEDDIEVIFATQLPCKFE